ncbi:MAG: glycosyl hydrolase family 18 protein [bacterium]
MTKTFIKIAIVIIIIFASVGVILALVVLKKTTNSPLTPSPTPTLLASRTPSPSYTPMPTRIPTKGAWIPNWGSTAGLASLNTKSKQFQDISPVWYEVNIDGTLINKRPKEAAQIISVLTKNNVKIIPAIAMFDHEIFSPVLQTPENLDRHVQAICSESAKQQYDGIDLDYESTKLSDKEKYFEFISKLSQCLHQQNDLLYVTVLAKWGDDISYPSLPETREVQDWSEIARFADQIRIMAYDYTYSQAAFPGPIAPLSWMEQISEYAVTKVDPDKLALGIHLYGYEWFSTNESDLTFHPVNEESLLTGNKNVRSYTYDTILGILKNYPAGELSDFEGEKVFKYKKGNEYRVLVFIDPAGIQARINLAQKYHLKGVVFWRLGGESSLL